MTMTQGAPTTLGRHAGPPAEVDRADLEIERLVEAGVPSGLPAGLGDNQGMSMRGSHAAEASQHLPWRLFATSALAVLVVLALAFIALDAVVPLWSAGGHAA